MTDLRVNRPAVLAAKQTLSHRQEEIAGAYRALFVFEHVKLSSAEATAELDGLVQDVYNKLFHLGQEYSQITQNLQVMADAFAEADRSLALEHGSGNHSA